MRKYILAAISVILIFGLSACGGAVKSTAEASPDFAGTVQVAESGGGLEWPKEYMGILPIPKSRISLIERLSGTETLPENDTTTKPSSVNVTMNEMTKEEAQDYYDQLKNAGFTIYKDEKDGEDILLSGALDSGGQSLFLFNYEAEDHLGNVSITFPALLLGGD